MCVCLCVREREKEREEESVEQCVKAIHFNTVALCMHGLGMKPSNYHNLLIKALSLTCSLICLNSTVLVYYSMNIN